MFKKEPTVKRCLHYLGRLPERVNQTTASVAAPVFLFIGVGVLAVVPTTSSVTPYLNFSVNPSKAIQLQVYFDCGEGFTEEHSVQRSLKAEQTAQVKIDLPPSTRSVRIDPSMAPGDVLIGDLRWRNQDKSIALQRKITSTRGGTIQIQADGLLFSSDSIDPQIVVAVPNSSEVHVDWSYRVLRGGAMTLIAISIIGLTLLWASVPVLSRTLSLQLGVAITLVFLIATKSDFGSHPDEGSHNAAASYYQKHWLTKNVDDPEMRATLISTFGTSYLYLKDCVYFLAGKWGALLSGSGADEHVVYRWFNVALLAALLITLSGKSWSSVCFLGAVCFTPQVWYIFSYFNGDGLSFAAAVAFCCYFAAQKDAIVRFFAGQVDKYSWVDVGSSYVMSDVLAAFLYGQLEQWRHIQAKRKAIWERYDEALGEWREERGIRGPVVPDHCEQAYHMYYLLMPSLEARSDFIACLKEKGVTAVFHYLPLHLSSFAESRKFGAWSMDKKAQCPLAEDVSERLVRLPMYTSMTEDVISRVVEAVRSFSSHT